MMQAATAAVTGASSLAPTAGQEGGHPGDQEELQAEEQEGFAACAGPVVLPGAAKRKGLATLVAGGSKRRATSLARNLH